jgi:hypothetical protein
MAVRIPLKVDNGDLRQLTGAEITAIQNEAARLYGLNPSVTLSVVTSGGSLGNIADTRLQAGAMSQSNTATPPITTTEDVSTITVNHSKINQARDTSESPWSNGTYSYPLYYDNGDLREMTETDFADTFIKPAINILTNTTANPGTYFVSTTAGGISGATLLSATPIFTDTRYNLPTLSTTAFVSYEVIGGGGEGGGGYLGGTGASGGTSSITGSSGSGFTTATSAGGPGAGGSGGTSQAGFASYYGPGGAGGINSDSNRQTPGYPAPSTSYGAGGGGGGAWPFSANNGGAGGGAATRQTGTQSVNVGSSLTVVIGSGGSAISGGGNGAGGYAKVTVDGTVYEYTIPGTYTINVTSASIDLPFPEDDPVTITNYYLYKQNGTLDEFEHPLPVTYTKTGINLAAIPDADFSNALETMVRYYAAEVTGSRITYTINGTGTTQGTAMTDTKLNSSQYLTDYIPASDLYQAQEIPAGTASTISTYALKISQT